MNTSPDGTKRIVQFTDYGIDQNGEWVHFGFKFENASPAHFETNHKALGVAINYLQKIANEARVRRMKLDPQVADKEARASPSNPMMQTALEPDLQGNSATFVCTALDGQRIEAQLSMSLLRQFLENIPKTITEMERRQKEQKHRH